MDEKGKVKEGLRLVELRVSNIMRVKAAVIRPEGAVTVLAGDNDAGKSTIVNALLMPLLGKRGMPREPLRRGAEKGWTAIDFGDVKARVMVTKKNTYLGVRIGDIEPRTPQAVIDRLIGAASEMDIPFDPMEIVRMGRSPDGRRRQIKMLLSAGGYDWDSDEKVRAEAYQERTLVNREIGRLEAKLADMPEAGDPGPEPVGGTSELEKEIAAEEDRERGIIQAQSDLIGKEELLSEIRKGIEQKERELEAARVRAGEVDVELAKAKEYLSDQAPVRTADLKAELAAVVEKRREWQVKMTAALEHETVSGEIVEKKEESARLSGEVEAVHDRRAAALTKLPLPVEGLGYDRERDCLTWNSELLDQVAESDQLLVGMGVIAALLPRDGIRICIFHNWDNLNDEHHERVRLLAEKYGLQVLAVRVMKEKAGDTLWICDGKCPDDLPDDIEEMPWGDEPGAKTKGGGAKKAEDAEDIL
jgi:hypothetical protein